MLWSGRRDLNPGPLAPQSTFINHLQNALNDNTPLSGCRFGPSLDPVCKSVGVWTQIGPCFSRLRHATCLAHAVVSATSMFSPFRETRDEDMIFPCTCRMNHAGDGGVNATSTTSRLRVNLRSLLPSGRLERSRWRARRCACLAPASGAETFLIKANDKPRQIQAATSADGREPDHSRSGMASDRLARRAY